MSYQTAFPDFPVADMPVIPATFADTSWHNDCAPCFTSEALKLILWVQYANPTEREFGGSRYILCTTDTPVGKSDEIIATDDWQAVLDAIAAR